MKASRFGQSGMAKIGRTDSLAVQLERTGRYMDAVHTYDQSGKMLVIADRVAFALSFPALTLISMCQCHVRSYGASRSAEKRAT